MKYYFVTYLIPFPLQRKQLVMWLWLFCFACAITSCSNQRAPQISDANTGDGNNTTTTKGELPERITLNQSPDAPRRVYNWLGAGYVSSSENVKGSCVTGGTWSVNVGQHNSNLNYQLAESKKRFMKELKLSGEIEVDFLIVTAKAGASVARKKATSNYNLYIILTIEGNLGTLSLLQPKLSNEAEILLRTKGHRAFIERCGDVFASSVTLGGKYHAIIRLDALSEEVRKTMKAFVEAKVKLGFFTKTFRKDIDEKFSKLSSVADIHYSVIQSPQVLTNLATFTERDFVSIADDQGNYAPTQGIAQFLSVADEYIKGLEKKCVFTPGNDGIYGYPQECVMHVGLQDYFTLTPLPKEPNIEQLTYESNAIKTSGIALMSVLSEMRNDAWYYTQAPYLFTDASASKVQRIKAIYDTVTNDMSSINKDLSHCLKSYDAVPGGRCQNYLPASSVYQARLNTFNNLKSEIPTSAELAADTLPQSCDQLYSQMRTANITTLDEDKAYKLFYLGTAHMPYEVYCFSDPTRAGHYQEYIKLPRKDKFISNRYSQFLEGIEEAHKELGTASRVGNQGRVQQFSWNYVRLHPEKMLLDLQDKRFMASYGNNLNLKKFGVDTNQGLSLASVLLCPTANSNDKFLISTLSLANTSFVFDEVTLDKKLWVQKSEQDESGVEIKRSFDQSKQRLVMSVSTKNTGCVYTAPTVVRVLPKGYLAETALGF